MADANQKVLFIKTILNDLETMDLTLTDKNAKIRLHELMDTVKYSDPMSPDALKEMEAQILANMEEIKEAVLLGDFALAASLMKEQNHLFIERNSKCKLLK